MPRLRLFAFCIDWSRLGPCIVRQDWTTNYNMLSPDELEIFYLSLAHDIFVPVSQLDCLAITDNDGMAYVVTRTEQGPAYKLWKGLERGDRRFPMGIED